MLAGLNTTLSVVGCVFHSSKPASLNPATNVDTGALGSATARFTPALGRSTAESCCTAGVDGAPFGGNDDVSGRRLSSLPQATIHTATVATRNRRMPFRR